MRWLDFLSHHLEDVAVRVMYFATTTDSFVICAALVTMPLLHLFRPVDFQWLPMGLGMALVYAAFKVADFYPTFILLFPVFGFFLGHSSGFSWRSLAGLFLLNVILAVAVQFVFQSTPHMVASRDPSVPLRMLLNSTLTLAPTTLSLPVSVAFAGLLAATLYYHPALTDWPFGSGYYLAIFAGAGLVRWWRPRTFVPQKHQPPNRHSISRKAIIFNLDGFSLHAFRRAHMPFLKRMAEEYAHAPEGAMTVYRALTNPAFASIITGAPPTVHGVVNNNFGQPIRVDGLPDVVKARLYGSIHVKHFSKPHWVVRWFSLVSQGAERTEEQVFEALRQDILSDPQTRLFILDVSHTDFNGHSYGTYSRQYLEAGEATDRLIEEFCGWLQQQRLYDDFTIIVSADHGMFMIDHSYLVSDQEIYTPLIVFGSRIQRNSCIPGPVSIMDINANVSYILAVPYNSHSVGRVFEAIYQQNPGVGETHRPS